MKNIVQPVYSYDDVEIIDYKTVYQGFFCMKKYRLRFKLFDGNWSSVVEREIFERGESVAVLPFDPVTDKVILIEQFRPGPLGGINDKQSPWLLEIIAGIVEPGEKIIDVAHREAKEEANLSLIELLPITSYWVSPGASSEKLSLFCARVNAEQAGGIFGTDDESENIKVHCLQFNDVCDFIENKIIHNVHTLVALQWLQINRNKLKKIWK